MIEAFTDLHCAGHAHSIECWEGDNLAGGLYGVALGGLFAGESMFHVTPNASKAALAHLIHHLQDRGFLLLDIQMITPVTLQFGALEIPRADYLQRLEVALQLGCQW